MPQTTSQSQLISPNSIILFIEPFTLFNPIKTNMKTSTALILAVVAGTADAFVPVKSTTSSTSLYAITAPSGRQAQVKKSIKTATKDNFSSIITEIEPFLTKEAGSSVYKKSMNRLKAKSKMFGTALPDGYAKEAKCTEKKREKQDAYCKAKAEEAAEVAAAEAPEEEAPAEEAPAEETPAEE